jgi:hypothetical protein
VPIYFFEQFEGTPLHKVRRGCSTARNQNAEIRKRAEEFGKSAMGKVPLLDWDHKEKIQFTTARGDNVKYQSNQALCAVCHIQREKLIVLQTTWKQVVLFLKAIKASGNTLTK